MASPIQNEVGDEQSSSYKAPWSNQNARVAMTTAGRYEAGGNAMWLSVCPQEATQRILAGRTASLEEVRELEAQFFRVILRSKPPGAGDVRTWERLIFPDKLPVGVRDEAVIYQSEHWQMELPVVCGHCYLWAWYLAMSKALAAWADPQPQRGDNTDPLACVACLLECALTVTIHARECPTDKELGLFSNEVSEKKKASEKLRRATRSLRSQKRRCSSSSPRLLGRAPAAARGSQPPLA